MPSGFHMNGRIGSAWGIQLVGSKLSFRGRVGGMQLSRTMLPKLSEFGSILIQLPLRVAAAHPELLRSTDIVESRGEASSWVAGWMQLAVEPSGSRRGCDPQGG